MTRVYLIRHGEIPQAEPRCFVGRQDPPLTGQGRQQITRLGQYLAGKDIDRVVASPLLRCRESADILCNRLQPLRAEIDDSLQEISLGNWEGQSVVQVRTRYPGDYERRGQDPLHFRPPRGESFADLLGRAWPSFQQTAVANRDERIALVTHSGVIRVLLFRILGLLPGELFRLKVDYGSCTILVHDGSRWRVETLNLKL